MTRLLTPVRVPAVAMLLLALSALAGNLVQWEQKADLEAQAKVNNDEEKCRFRIAGYVDGLDIDKDIAQGIGTLDRLGPNDDTVFEQAIEDYTLAVEALRIAKEYREHSVEVCATNPQFDPSSDMVEGGP